jgi:capsular exopolysaccharide synthesis family protein
LVRGSVVTFNDFIKLLRTRWLTIVLTSVAGVLGAVVVTLMTTPLYQSTTRLFVSTTAGATASELYQGNRLSQDRVLSYTELLVGETLAQRTVDKLNLEVSAKQLKGQIEAKSKAESVLITLKVLDPSPVRARDLANALSDEFVVMVRELETPQPGARPDGRVVVEQRASVAEAPTVPKTSRNIALGIVLGLSVGLGLAFLRDALDNSIKDPEVLSGVTGVGLVGSIPIDKERREKPGISFDRDNSAIAEAFRKLRTNLKFLSVDNPPRVIVVTSSTPSEGKTTTAINIALALAEAEHDVVLVDGDLRRPAVDKYLDLVGAVGFSTILSGGATTDDALQQTMFPRLTVLTAGTTPPNPSELLGSMAARKLLAELRSKFDYVIVDSAPLLAVTDAAILATNADGAIMVARYGHVKRDQVKHAVGNINDVGATLLGTVVTMTPTRGNSAYSYNYSYSYYGDKTGSAKQRSAMTDQDGLTRQTESESAQDWPGRADAEQSN